jgi:RNA polymerase sigma-70 factor (ECF subfamily)
MQHADAEDLAQQVLVSVSRAITRWENDPQRARFRTWLRRVTNNAIINALTRQMPDRAAGGTDFVIDQPAAEGPDSERLRIEYRREVFRWAARRIRQEFHAGTWDAFWLSTVEGREVEQVARILGKTPGAVYAARSRVMRRLRQEVKEFEET